MARAVQPKNVKREAAEQLYDTIGNQYLEAYAIIQQRLQRAYSPSDNESVDHQSEAGSDRNRHVRAPDREGRQENYSDSQQRTQSK